MLVKAKAFILNGIREAKDKLIVKRNPIKWIVFSYFSMVALLVMTYYSACYDILLCLALPME